MSEGTFEYAGLVRLGEAPEQGWRQPVIIGPDGLGLDEALIRAGLIEYEGTARLRILVEAI